MHLIYVVLWVLPSVLVGVGVGVRIGLGISKHRQKDSFDKERNKTLKVLQTVLQSTEQLTKDVDTHNAELETVERNVAGLKGTGQLEDIQNALLTQITTLLESNQRLEDDLVCTHYQLKEQTQELDRVHKEARIDELSGIPNRKSFNERLLYLLALYNRHQKPFALILADVDRFKWINDTYGHLVGDQVVSRIGETLMEGRREEDFVARYGGDEFTLLLSDVDCHTAEDIAERNRLLVARTNFVATGDHERLAVSLCIGVANVRQGDTPESIIGRADDALYEAKNGGRNQVCSDMGRERTLASAITQEAGAS